MGGEGVGALCTDESMAEVHLGRDRKKMSGWKGDTLRRDALQGNECVCRRVISCSRGQERWRTELELCCGESFDDDHRSAALGTAPQSRFRIRFSVEWPGERRSAVVAERRVFGKSHIFNELQSHSLFANREYRI